MRRMGVLIAAATLGLSAALTGCGSSEEPTESTQNTDNQASESKETPAEESTPEEEEGSAASGDDKAYCDLLQTAQSDLSELSQVDPSKSSGALEEVAKTINDISAAAPSDIKEHWTVMADTMDQSVSALDELEKAMKDPANADQKKLNQLQKDMEQAATDAQKASDAVVADTKTRCGFALETGQ